MSYLPKILIVDDDPRTCESLNILLGNEGYEIQTRRNGQEALQALIKNDFDVVLLDLVLPDISGAEIMDHINSQTPEALVIVITGHASWDSAVESLKKGAFDYLRKPFEHEELSKAVKNALEQRQLKSEHRRVEGALRESEERYRAVFEQAADSIVLIDGETGELVEFNKRAHDNLGFSREEFEKLKIPDFEVIESAEEVAKHIEKVINEGADSFETKHRTKGGEIRDIQVSTRAISIRGKNFIHAIWRDITNRKRAEEQMKASLREKEVLLNEIHHRVRNNFQIISSLLDLTSMRIDNQQVRDLLSETRAKIHAMALVHTQLYEQGRFDQVDMGGHMRKLVDYLSHTYGGRGRSIHTMIEPSDVYLTLSQAIPCALVLSEIISNAFKHAFVERQKGTIEISMQRSADNTIFVTVKDDGVGMPGEIDINKVDGLGLKLTRNLVQDQLKGKIQVKRSTGTDVYIEFKAIDDEEPRYA